MSVRKIVWANCHGAHGDRASQCAMDELSVNFDLAGGERERGVCLPSKASAEVL